MKIDTKLLENKKNLLAFSAGIDSTALFFLLKEHNIDFDIAIVNYNIRQQANQEVSYAKKLADKYKKKCFIKEVNIVKSNFEKNARDIRYNFFEELIQEYHYDNLITAHQLNDKLEWFLMQFTKGAGLVELDGLNEQTAMENYKLIRPLLNYSKDDLLEYLENKDIKYFIDESNFDDKYKRNYFRRSFANKLLEEYEIGIKKSFKYLNNDVKSLNINNKAIIDIKGLEIFKSFNDNNKNIRIIDKSLKRRGYILSTFQRDEIIKQKEIVIDNFSISLTKKFIWITPNSNFTMDKKFKEICRINKIPKKSRAYLKENNLDIKELKKLLLD